MPRQTPGRPQDNTHLVVVAILAQLVSQSLSSARLPDQPRAHGRQTQADQAARILSQLRSEDQSRLRQLHNP